MCNNQDRSNLVIQKMMQLFKKLTLWSMLLNEIIGASLSEQFDLFKNSILGL